MNFDQAWQVLWLSPGTKQGYIHSLRMENNGLCLRIKWFPEGNFVPPVGDGVHEPTYIPETKLLEYIKNRQLRIMPPWHPSEEQTKQEVYSLLLALHQKQAAIMQVNAILAQPG